MADTYVNRSAGAGDGTKYRFVRYVERLEDIWITGVPPQDIALMRGRDS